MTDQNTNDAIVLNHGPDEGEIALSVIWLHGLGADANDFAPVVPMLQLPPAARIRFIFPNAPIRPITINGGMKMRGWYDIYSLNGLDKQDKGGTEASADIVRAFIDEELKQGVPPKRIVLAGFSQGGAIALHTGLRYPEKLAGIMALSTYLPLHTEFADERNTANNDVPILMCHGNSDPVLPHALGTWSRDLLQEMGYDVQWQDYPMDHSVCPQELADISHWLTARLNAC